MYIFSTLRHSVLLLAMLCAACGTALPSVKPYKLDVQQGNVVTSKMLLQLRPGMTKSQVRFIMGTPLIQDSFHGNRWDYVYQMREKGKITEQRRVILDFENEVLKTVRGDVAPTGSDVAPSTEGAANTGTRTINSNAKPEEKSILGKLKFWEKDEAELAAEAAATKAADKSEAAKTVAELPKENLAKDDLLKTDLANDNKAPVEEPAKSILAVPMDILPVTETTTAALAVPVVVTPDATTPVTEPAKLEVAPTEAVLASPALPEPEMPAPLVPSAYNSPSGMQFDRTLKLTPENVEFLSKPEVAMPRAGNKTIPKPKDLPVENTPSFFDRMLEKIGF
jgi:outer membrane protein assembly factor BamE